MISKDLEEGKESGARIRFTNRNGVLWEKWFCFINPVIVPIDLAIDDVMPDK